MQLLHTILSPLYISQSNKFRTITKNEVDFFLEDWQNEDAMVAWFPDRFQPKHGLAPEDV